VEINPPGRTSVQVTEPDELWTAAADLLRYQVSEAVWLTCFKPARAISLDEHRFVLGVPSAVFKDRIESRYASLLVSALGDAGAPDLALEIRVLPSERPTPVSELRREPAPDEPETAVEPRAPRPESTSARRNAAAQDDFDEPGSGINPRYTFDQFVTGTSNRFAQAAALAVAEMPARSYNPLFIYGEPGLGKTHLLQAVAHYVRENYSRTHIVKYVTTESFLNQYVDAIRGQGMQAFKQRYRNVDVLLIDDIQFIEGKEATQEELFHTFNHLHQANSQLVFSSDRPPDAIATLEDRLRSRFKMGLITEINPPDLETRLAILRKKAESESPEPPADVLEFIASHITNNIRELEGALIRVCAYASLTKEPLSAEMADRVLADLISDSRPRPITPEVILEATSQLFNFPIEEIRGKSRRRPLVQARQISMYVFRELTDMSYPAIAREYDRDHTTVIHAVERVTTMMKEKRQVYDQVTELTQVVRNGG
jgi:chromosomal replication initiator protein